MPTLSQQASDAGLEQVAPLLFYAFALLTGLSAWAVVISQNIVRMSVYLLMTLAGAAGLYFMLGAEFLAAIQLIVYVGGTLILIVFGIMLTNKSPFAQLRTEPWEMVLGVFIAVVTAALLIFALSQTPMKAQGEAILNSGYDQVRAVGVGLLTKYLMPFEAVAVLLLVVMVGAAFMARQRARK